MQPIRIDPKVIQASIQAPAIDDVIDITPERVEEPAKNRYDWQWHLTGAETPEEKHILEQMLEAGRSFVADIIRGEEPRWLVLVGPSGCGKTYLAERICAWMREHGRRAFERERQRTGREGLSSLWVYSQEGSFMVRWSRLLSRLRGGEWGALEVAAGDWFKAIDDLGTDVLGADGQATNFAVQKMGDLCDRRLRKWTIITTNFSRKEIAEKFDVRIASRLMRHDNVIVDCTGLRDYSLRREATLKVV